VAIETPAALAISRIVARGLPLLPAELMTLFKQMHVTVSSNQAISTSFRNAEGAWIALAKRYAPLDRSVTFW
jgi:hypothetical protein